MRIFLFLFFGLFLATCTDRSYSPVVPSALDVGTPKTVFAATSRTREADGSFAHRRSETLSLLELTVSIPLSRTPGSLDFAYANPNPNKQFTLAAREEFNNLDAFSKRLNQKIRQEGVPSRDVTIFVHGYNSTQTETAFRAAQLSHDIQLPGAMVIYSWPSRGKPFGYAYDYDSVLFARDGLESVIQKLKSTGVDNIFIVAHSIGSVLTMEMLRQADIREPGWADRNLSGVVLLSPDIDVDLFKSQMGSLKKVPQPFVVVVSEKDRALNISGRLRGNSDAQRLGNISSIAAVADLPISVVDTTAFAGDAQSSHLVAGTSPTLIAMLQSVRAMDSTFDSDPGNLDFFLPEGADPTPDHAREIVLDQGGFTGNYDR
ncbi:alpha/beta hydrolase [Tropicibacter sp. Alg240-R139]|uniref:alpha/beta hydrolase n=1 Tax=Tropicibacter sp. Alg240-R139 TaxID=2305991 RepID=UPI001F07D67E|nr:alpha/beta fold hydrolase [Tropicibacter sp. Alg240-R139]